MQSTALLTPTASDESALTAYTKAFISNQSCRMTKITYATEIKLFYSVIGKRAQDVTLSDLIAYKEYLATENRRPSTIAKKLAVLRSFFTFFYQQGIIPTNPSAGLKLPKVSNETTRDILTLAECNRLLSSVGTSTIRDLRDRAILALLAINALRICEVSRANVGDLIHNDGFIVLRVHGKGGKEADARIREDVYKVIQAYLEARGILKAGEPLFTGTTHRKGIRIATRTIQHLVKKYMKRIGISRKNVSSHSLRHSACSHLITAGASLLAVQEFARHASPVVTQRYIHQKDKLKNHAVIMNPITIQA